MKIRNTLPGRLRVAHLTRGPTGAGTPVGPGMPAAENPSPLMTRYFPCLA